MKLRLNPDFARRYAAVALLFFGMGGWFGYDGLVRYPRTGAAALYEEIEKAPPGPEWTPEALDGFKRQKIQSQLGLMAALWAAAAVVAFVLWRAWRFDFAFDDEGFCWQGRRFGMKAVRAVDWRQWRRKGIVIIFVEGRPVRLDAWHHQGVDAFAAKLPAADGDQREPKA